MKNAILKQLIGNGTNYVFEQDVQDEHNEQDKQDKQDEQDKKKHI